MANHKGVSELEKEKMIAEEKLLEWKPENSERVYRVVAVRRGGFRMSFGSEPRTFLDAVTEGRRMFRLNALKGYDLFLSKEGSSGYIGEFTDMGYVRSR